ncbi:hypothetical protein M0802_003571 [Mischocyttarus mexicanus]|nr:hypothetical protein M0802_003571 [Mischocyttarus mexicanus]
MRDRPWMVVAVRIFVEKKDGIGAVKNLAYRKMKSKEEKKEEKKKWRWKRGRLVAFSTFSSFRFLFHRAEAEEAARIYKSERPWDVARTLQHFDHPHGNPTISTTTITTFTTTTTTTTTTIPIPIPTTTTTTIAVTITGTRKALRANRREKATCTRSNV